MALFHQIVLPALGVEERLREVWSGVAAVVMVNLVILSFTVFAFVLEKDDEATPRDKKNN
jgi:hypothetical protein